MQADHALFSGESLRLVQGLRSRMELLETGRSEGIEAIANPHPQDLAMLVSRWRKWLKECGLRRQEFERLEYLVWLREEREKTIRGMVDNPSSSPVHAFYEELLPIIRAEISQEEHQKPSHTDILQLRKQVMDLVKHGRLVEAVELLDEYLEQKQGPDLRHRKMELIHLQSELAHFNQSERKGILPFETIRTGRNQLLHSLLGILDELAPT